MPVRTRLETAADLSSLLNNISDLIIGCDHDWRVMCVNDRMDAYLQTVGLGRDALIGQELWEACPALRATRFQTEVVRAVASGTEVTFEEAYPPLDRWFALRVTPTRHGVLACARDITDSKRAEAALARSEERFRTLVESLDDVVFRLDRDQRCTDVHGRWLERQGVEPQKLLGRTIREIVGDGDALVHESAAGRALRGESVSYEWSLRGPVGTRHMQTSLAPLRSAAGDVVGAVGVGRDLTERRRTEEQVRQAQKMEAIGRLAGGIAHDFNNMMMIIMGFSDVLTASLDAGDARRGDAEEIRKAAERAMQLTRQLLSFGRRQTVARRTIDLNQMLGELDRVLRSLVGEDIALVLAPAPDLGLVEADQGQLEQVVMNLALNARDAMPGGGQLTIETFNVDVPSGQHQHALDIDLPPGSYVVLTVHDSGIGMSPEVKARLFEPFYTTKPPSQNTGLGLATVYTIVSQNSGLINVESEVGQGTRFSIFLPRSVAHGEAYVASERKPTAPAGGSETVLLVEDEEALRQLAQRELAQHGYRVLEAANGREALTVAERHPGTIDLLLTDVVMPEMGGRELASALLTRRPSVRVLYMSGYSESDKLTSGIFGSPHHFLQKPFSLDSLVRTIRRLLDRPTS